MLSGRGGQEETGVGGKAGRGGNNTRVDERHTINGAGFGVVCVVFSWWEWEALRWWGWGVGRVKACSRRFET